MRQFFRRHAAGTEALPALLPRRSTSTSPSRSTHHPAPRLRPAPLRHSRRRRSFVREAANRRRKAVGRAGAPLPPLGSRGLGLPRKRGDLGKPVEGPPAKRRQKAPTTLLEAQGSRRGLAPGLVMRPHDPLLIAKHLAGRPPGHGGGRRQHQRLYQGPTHQHHPDTGTHCQARTSSSSRRRSSTPSSTAPASTVPTTRWRVDRTAL